MAILTRALLGLLSGILGPIKVLTNCSDSILSVDILAMITTICPHFALVWLNDSYVYHPSTFFSTWKFVSVVHARQDEKKSWY